jgi:hypothetical protein
MGQLTVLALRSRGRRAGVRHRTRELDREFPLLDSGPLVAFTLDAVDAKKPMAALVAAVGVVVGDAPPITESADRPSGVCVRYAEDKGH